MDESISANGQPARSKDGSNSTTGHSFRCGDYSTSYPERVDRAVSLGAALAQFDVRPDDRVLIMLPDGPGIIQACAGVGHWGAVPLPVSPLLANADVTAAATETGARLVLTQAERVHGLADLDADPPVLVDRFQGLWAAALR